MRSLAELMDDTVLEADLDAAFAEYEQLSASGQVDGPGKNHGIFSSDSERSPNISEWIANAAWNK